MSLSRSIFLCGRSALGETNEAFYQRLDSQPERTTNPATPTQLHLPLPAGTTPTASSPLPGSPAMHEGSGSASDVHNNINNEAESEGWTCSQCTFQNHPQLNMCEQCGMVKRSILMHHHHQRGNNNNNQHQPQQQQQQQQPHPQPAGIVQITSSQFIPALGPPRPNGTVAAGGALVAASPVATTMTPPNPNSAHLPPNLSPYLMQGYAPTQQQSPRMIYSSPMCQYPPVFAYPNVGISPNGTAASSPQHQLTPPPIVVGTGKSPKGKRGSKFNSKLSQSISNLFSSSSSSTSSTSGNNSHVNSQE